MTYAVIASNSFSGSWMVDTLLKSSPDAKVIGISRLKEHDPLFLPYRQWKHDRFQFFPLDVNRDMAAILDVLDQYQPAYIINLAAQGEVGTSWKYPAQWYQTNAMAVVQLTNALKDRAYIKSYVHISTPEVYGACQNVKEDCPINPTSPYAASKASGDLFVQTLARQYNFPAMFIRSTNVYGPHQQLYRIIPRTVLYLKMGKKIQLQGGGKAVKSYIHIQDVCEGVWAAMHAHRPGEVFHFSPDESISIRDLVERLCRMSGYDFNTCVDVVEDRPGQDAMYVIDSTKARQNLKWKPKITIDCGLKQTMDWALKNYDQLIKTPLEYKYVP